MFVFGARIAIVIYFKVHYKQGRGLVSPDGIVRLAQGINTCRSRTGAMHVN